MSNPPNLLGNLVDIALAAIPGWGYAILAVAAAFAAFYTLYVGLNHVLAAITDTVYYRGAFYDKQEYYNYLQRLHTFKRRGGLLDAESHRILRRYQGIPDPSPRRGRGLPRL